MTSAAEYVLGTDEAEYQRLGLQHRLWSDLAHQSWMHARIAPGMRVLDVGSGPGHATADLAQIVGSTGGVTAVDESALFIERLRENVRARSLENVQAHVADVQRLPTLGLPENSYDIAYARWVLCFVPDPAAVIAGVARLLKPGGRVCVNDYFNYESMTIAPKNPAFSRGIAAVGRSWRERGGDPDLVGRLPRLAADAGLRVTHLRVHQRLARPGDTMWAWPDSFWKNFIPRLAQTGHLTQREAEEFFDAWRRVGEDPHSFMLLPPVFEFIAEKA
ncbi:MAG: methyltransferase domain-containing protein [Phycisphaerae bacterium]|nr:methyltransferase domain-containing protein [Phycisphaerae bacterium]